MNDNTREVRLGEPILITTNNSRVLGILRAHCTYLNSEGKYEKLYSVCIGEHLIDIHEHEIIEIATLDDIPDKENYLKEEIERKHEIKCFDSDNKMLSNSVIMGNMLDHNAWDDLTEDEKKEFANNICFSEDDIVEILNVLFDYRSENQKLHDKRLKALEKATKSIEIYHDFLEKIPYANIVCSFMYEQMKIKDLVNSI